MLDFIRQLLGFMAQRSCSTLGSVSTWMGDLVQAGKPCWYAT